MNWLPDPIRDLFAAPRRIYTQRKIRALFDGLEVEFDVQSHIFPGLDNVNSRHQFCGRWLHATVDLLESTPLRCFGISHFVVARKSFGATRSALAASSPRSSRIDGG